MPNFVFTRNIPGSQNNPSNDQSPMRANYNSTDSIIAEDHYSFNNTNGGLHKKVRLIDLLAIPPGLASGMGTLYTKLATSISPSTESNLFYTPDASGNEYQLTRPITASFALMGKLTQNYNAVGASFFGGWTFMAGNGTDGGMLYQYGYVNTSSSNVTIPFPVSFKAATPPFSIQVTASIDDNTTIRMGILSGSESATAFITNNTSSSHLKRIYWTAIGI